MNRPRSFVLMERGAIALDKSTIDGERGPRTMNARIRVATALDLRRVPRLKDILWLEKVGQTCA